MTIHEKNLQMTYNQSVDDRSALDQSFTMLPRLKSFQGYRTENGFQESQLLKVGRNYVEKDQQQFASKITMGQRHDSQSD
ncbi:hypothetical protein BHYA_0218g00160 [Botrytis hyacinthi]|uniref:Uncharacterized protein n=1 Tax=Botrytis hyacinthi TaxID=278943 RepID=A0A4Z1GIY8_9HELO|nr:hypothetical protein BHYA_0218g00160 [Botrytis hyacinthi]